MKRSRAALLDIDGTLVDSNDAHARAWFDAFARFGHDVPLVNVRRAIGMGGDNLMPAVIGVARESPEGREIAAYRERIFENALPYLEAFPCVPELVARLSDEGYAIVIATSAPRAEMHALLEIARITDRVHHTVAGDDVDASKPAPDVLCAALERAGVPPGASLMLGDTPYDIAAAQAARVPIVAVRSGGFHDADFRGAVAIYDQVADVHARYDRSLFVRVPFAA